MTTLSGHAATAADVNKSGAVTALDAFYILQKAVDLDHVAIPRRRGWCGISALPAGAFPNLNSDQSGHDFTAILLGDVSGNWAAAAPTRQSVLGGGQSSVVSGQLSAQAAQYVASKSTRSN